MIMTTKRTIKCYFCGQSYEVIVDFIAATKRNEYNKLIGHSDLTCPHCQAQPTGQRYTLVIEQLMCEINPKHTKIFRLEFFTSNSSMTEEEFEAIVLEHALTMEQSANSDMRIRCHIHDA
jgi:hypothetical protein